MKAFRYFNDLTTIEAIKQTYKKLALKFHPDLNENDTTEIMKAVNLEYEEALKYYKANTTDGKEQYKADCELRSDYREIINSLIKLGLEVELCGLWLWISGHTKPVKDELKNMGCKWAHGKSMWYWRPADLKYRKKSKRELSIDEIRNLYESEKMNGQRQEEEKNTYKNNTLN